MTGTAIIDAWSFGTPKFDQAADAIGHRITATRRRGKYLILDLSAVDPEAPDDDHPAERASSANDLAGRELVVHLGMTGSLSVRDSNTGDDGDTSDFESLRRPAHRRAEWLLDDDRVLEFTDIRRFGRIAVVDAGDHTSLPTLAAIGPEPFDDDFTPEYLRSRLMASGQAIKTQLMSQRVVAGLGNIYVDEALWLAGVHPDSRRITRAEAERLQQAIRTALESGLANGGTTLRDYRDAAGRSGTNQLRLQCYGRWGEPCNRCGRELRRVTISGRTTTFCPDCQRRRL